MFKNNSFLQDACKLAASAFNTSVNVKNYIQELSKQQLEEFFQKINLISREEFEIVKQIAAKNKVELEMLRQKCKKLYKNYRKQKKKLADLMLEKEEKYNKRTTTQI